MGSTASTTYQDYVEGKLITAITTGTTTGVTYKIKQVNGTTPTHPTAAHRLKIVQRTATGTKVEKVDVAAGTTQSGQTVTLGTLTRALPLSSGTDFTGSGVAQSFAAGADIFLAWDAHDAAQSAKQDIANTFTTHQTISSTNELRFTDTATAIWDDGTSLTFKDSTTAAKTLAQLAAAAGTDEKSKVSIDDTTSNYLASKITGGDGITVTETNGGGNETLDIDVELATDPGLEISSGALRAKIKASSGLVRDSNGLSVTLSDFNLAGRVYSNTADSTQIVNTDVETDFSTTYTIPANGFVAAGSSYRLKAWLDANSVGASHTYKVKLGSTTLLTSSAVALNSDIYIEALLVCRATGASGSVIGTGNFFGGDVSDNEEVILGAAQTVDTTATNVLKISLTMNAAQAGSNATIKNIIIERLP